MSWSCYGPIFLILHISDVHKSCFSLPFSLPKKIRKRNTALQVCGKFTGVFVVWGNARGARGVPKRRRKQLCYHENCLSELYLCVCIYLFPINYFVKLGFSRLSHLYLHYLTIQFIVFYFISVRHVYLLS